MAHFAEVDENNNVLRVIVVDNKELMVNGQESEQKGKDFISSLGLGNNWIQTSYNSSFRGKFAGDLDKYDTEKNVFVPRDSYGGMAKNLAGELLESQSPSVMFDAASRCANNFTVALLTKAFPNTLIRWGYIYPHMPDSFERSFNIFDITMTVVRNPKDSIASSIVLYQSEKNEDILDIINRTKEMLSATLLNKDRIMIVKFEDMILNTDSVISSIQDLLGIEPESVDYELLNEELKNLESGNFYAVPIDNLDLLNTAKSLLDSEFYQEVAEATAIYNEIIG